MTRCGVCGDTIPRGYCNCRPCTGWANRLFLKFARLRTLNEIRDRLRNQTNMDAALVRDNIAEEVW